jgi:energy-coupling factor transporter ATP-binding protein EcfA2
MRLKSIDYSQFQGTEREWSLTGLTLGAVNLVVGKNASGKSRALSVINGLANLLCGKKKPSELSTGSYNTIFEHNGRLLHYTLEIQERVVTKEVFRDGTQVFLERGAGGSGKIFHEREGKEFDFQSPESECAVVTRADTIQHSFLEPLTAWGGGVRYYECGSPMGKPVIALLVNNGPPPDPTDANAVIALFRKADKDFPGKFAEAVRNDMNKIGYDVETIGFMTPTDIQIIGPQHPPVNPIVLYVKERDLPAVTQQTDMSQGMFRALAVLIHVNYAVIASRPTCIIIDDIGEGLDFDRSLGLIEVVQRRTEASDVQLLMATNDRFVMNNVPLNSWSILRRTGGKVRVMNYGNSKEIFDDFKFTGLSNFSFLEMDFAEGQHPEEPVANE